MSVTNDRPDVAGLPAAVENAQRAASEVTRLAVDLFTRRPVEARPRVRLTDWQRMQTEQARKLLMDAPGLFATRPDAYVAGLIEGAASNLLDIIDAVTEV